MHDFLPQAQARASIIEFSRAGFSNSGQVQIDRADFQLLESGMAARALALLCGVALALVLSAHPPRFLVWLSGDKTRARRGRPVLLSDVGPKGQLVAYPIFLLVVLGTLWVMLAPRTQLVGLYFLGALAFGCLLLLLSTFVMGGKKSGPRAGFSLLGALSATVQRLFVLVPVIAAALSRASEVGSLDLADMNHEQGLSPSQWAAVDSPLNFVLAVAYLVALVPLSGRRAPLEGRGAAQGPGLLVSRSAEWAGQLILTSVFTLLFAGQNGVGPEHLVTGGLLLSLKIAALTHLIAWVRARSGNLRLGESWGFFGVANLAASLGAAALSIGIVVTGLGETHAELLGLFAAALGGSIVVLFFVSSQRSWAHMGRRIDPWI